MQGKYALKIGKKKVKGKEKKPQATVRDKG